MASVVPGTADGARRRLLFALLAIAAGVSVPLQAADKPPVLIGIDGEFNLANSTSAQAIELGVRAALDQINRAGGVLGGRPLQVVTRDHRSIPARGIRNIEELAALPDLVAVMGGRFSPVVLAQLPVIGAAGLPFLAVWSSADPIVENDMQPNFVFRLSLRDSLAMPRMLDSASQRGLENVGLLLINTSWGRSNRAAAERHMALGGTPHIADVAWFNWREPSLIDKYRKLLDAGAQAVVLVANDDEAAVLVREVAALPPERRVPIISHWGITGGEFAAQAGSALQQVDLTVIQTFSFFNAEPRALARFLQSAERASGGTVRRIEDIKSPVGVAHAYDMTHILARAINLAGSTDRSAIRNALERVSQHRGLIKLYAPPFTPERHEALGTQDLLLARYRSDGVLVPVR
jgi:branched-chain amino acid transport system substrate-binding protein